MDNKAILSAIDVEIARLTEVRHLLSGSTPSAPAKRRGRAVGSKPAATPRKRGISPEGKARIAAAQRKRWAAAKKQK